MPTTTECSACKVGMAALALERGSGWAWELQDLTLCAPLLTEFNISKNDKRIS